MPHVNNLDLYVFSCMSKRNTMLARYLVNIHVLSEEKNGKLIIMSGRK